MSFKDKLEAQKSYDEAFCLVAGRNLKALTMENSVVLSKQDVLPSQTADLEAFQTKMQCLNF